MRKKLSVLCTTFLLPLLMTVPTFAADSPFSDVAPDAPYAESIAYLVEHDRHAEQQRDGLRHKTGSAEE